MTLLPGLPDRLLRMQDTEGGFRTGYDNIGSYAGTLANAETSSIIIITLNQLAERQLPQGLFPFFQSFSPAFFLLFLVVGLR